ncbi:MAG: BatA domain-containing protein [Planctomycetota bacterium]
MLLYPALGIGFAFVGVPLLVHLINLLRHRRTEWAAMEFLLVSYRKQRRWIVMRQLLLLLARLAVAALLVAVLAGWVGGGGWWSELGGQSIHHVVVLDDSYSMGQDHVGGPASPGAGVIAERLAEGGAGSAFSAGRRTAYDHALGSLQTLVRSLADSPGEHQLTLIRASRAAIAVQSQQTNADAAADLVGQTIGKDSSLVDRVMSSRASPLRVDVASALQLAGELIDALRADQQYLYVASDFSRRDWGAAARLRDQLTECSQAGAEIRLIDCGETASGATQAPRNLSIVDLWPSPDVWVAGVPVMMNATIKNHGDKPVRNLALNATVIKYGAAVEQPDPGAITSGVSEPLPVMMIESIGAGDEITKSFQVYVPETGTHAVRVRLPEDRLPIDNERVCTLPLAEAQRVLVIDGDPQSRGGRIVGTVLNPGSQVEVGAIPEIRSPSALRDMSREELASYRAIYMLDVPAVAPDLAGRLGRYVREGGGLAWFLGDQVDAASYNQNLGDDEVGLLSVRLVQPVTAGDGTNAASLASDESNAVRPDALRFGEDGAILGAIEKAGDGVFRLVRVPVAWQTLPIENSSDTAEGERTGLASPQVMLRRGDGLPIGMHHRLGRGRVVTFATGLQTRWNNWSGDPTFVVVLLQANAMLFSGDAPPTSRGVNDKLIVDLDSSRYVPTFSVLPPATQPPRLMVELESDPGLGGRVIAPEDALLGEATGLSELMTPGLIELQRVTMEGRSEVSPIAMTLQAGEGELTSVARGELIQSLLPLEVTFVSAMDWAQTTSRAGMSALLLVLLGLLAALLACEQALAAWASYHSQGEKHPGHASAAAKFLRAGNSNGHMPSAVEPVRVRGGRPS